MEDSIYYDKIKKLVARHAPIPELTEKKRLDLITGCFCANGNACLDIRKYRERPWNHYNIEWAVGFFMGNWKLDCVSVRSHNIGSYRPIWKPLYDGKPFKLKARIEKELEPELLDFILKVTRNLSRHTPQVPYTRYRAGLEPRQGRFYHNIYSVYDLKTSRWIKTSRYWNTLVEARYYAHLYNIGIPQKDHPKVSPCY